MPMTWIWLSRGSSAVADGLTHPDRQGDRHPQAADMEDLEHSMKHSPSTRTRWFPSDGFCRIPDP